MAVCIVTYDFSIPPVVKRAAEFQWYGGDYKNSISWECGNEQYESAEHPVSGKTHIMYYGSPFKKFNGVATEKEIIEAIESFEKGRRIGDCHGQNKERERFSKVLGLDRQIDFPSLGFATPIPEDEATQFNVFMDKTEINEYISGGYVTVVKALRKVISGLSITDAKQMISVAHCPLVEYVNRERADFIKEELGKAGAKIRIVPVA